LSYTGENRGFIRRQSNVTKNTSFFRNFEQDILAKLQNIELSKNLKKKVVTQELKNCGCCPCMNIKDFHFLNVHEK